MTLSLKDIQKASYRFWEKVDTTPGFGPTGECWEWTGGTQTFGYGSFRVKTEYATTAHRFAFQDSAQRVLSTDLVVRHRCDNPKCVRPDHLEEGTPADNIQDQIERGRAYRAQGPDARNAKLSWADVAQIRKLPGTSRAVGRRFGVSHTTVIQIRKGLRYAA